MPSPHHLSLFMEPSSITRTSQPRTGLRRPNHAPIHRVQRRPPTPYVKRRTVVDEHLHLLEAFHQTHISSVSQHESNSTRGDSGPGSGNSLDERNADAQIVTSTHRVVHELNISTRTSERFDPANHLDLQGSQLDDPFWIVRLRHVLKIRYLYQYPVINNTRFWRILIRTRHIHRASPVHPSENPEQLTFQDLEGRHQEEEEGLDPPILQEEQHQ